MNDIKIFNNDIFGSIRVAGTGEKPLFCLADICGILSLGDPSQVKTTLKESGVISNEVSTPIISQGVNTGKTKNTVMNFITESNLYRCVFQSRKPDAEKFQDWVCDEVLPSIRKHGAYMTGETLEKALMSPDFLISLATNLKVKQQKEDIGRTCASSLTKRSNSFDA